MIGLINLKIHGALFAYPRGAKTAVCSSEKRGQAGFTTSVELHKAGGEDCDTLHVSMEPCLAVGGDSITSQSQVSLLRSLKEMWKRVQEEHPRSRKILRISNAALLDWRALRQSDWELNNWEGEDQDLTSADRSHEVYLQALQRRLAWVGVSSVEVVREPYMEVVPMPNTDQV